MYKRLLLAGVVALGAMAAGTPTVTSAGTVNEYRSALRDYCASRVSSKGCIGPRMKRAAQESAVARQMYNDCKARGDTDCDAQISQHWDELIAEVSP